MRRTVWISVAVIVGVCAVLLLIRFRLQTRWSSVGIVATELVDADRHKLRVAECAQLAMQARYNHRVIERVAGYVATLGSNTEVYMEIARIAAKADRPCERLASVLDLSIVQMSESLVILQLARESCELEQPDQWAQWQKRYDALLAWAQYPSVEEALANMRGAESER